LIRSLKLTGSAMYPDSRLNKLKIMLQVLFALSFLVDNYLKLLLQNSGVLEQNSGVLDQ